MKTKRTQFFLKLIAPLLFFESFNSYSCTAFLLEGIEQSVVAKNLDWVSGKGMLLVNKRKIQKEAIFVDTQKPLKWISKYSSISFTGSAQEFPWEGMNEEGLSVNALQLIPTEVPNTNEKIPSIGYVQWIQYILDTSSSISEAIENAKKVRVSPGATLHYFVCDRNSQCATFEYIKGELIIHSGDQLPIKALSNDTYQNSLEAYKSSESVKMGLSALDPGDNRSLARFFRAGVLSQQTINDDKQLIERAFEALENLSQKHETTPLAHEWLTHWRIVFDPKNLKVYWKTLQAPQLKSLSLRNIDADCASSALYIDVDFSKAGLLNTALKPISHSVKAKLVESWAQDSLLPISSEEKYLLTNYSALFSQCLH